MKHARLCGLAALAAALVAVPAAANHSWGNYHWANADGQVQLTINVAVTSQWTVSVNNAVADWENGNPDVLQLTKQNSTANRKKCSPIAGQILVCNEAYGPRGWLGIASITLDTKGHIKTGTTKLNDSYFNTATYDKPEWRALVACQEIGHDFGLGHQDEGFGAPNLGTCMDYTNSPSGGGTYGPANTSPNRHDFDQLASIYGHTDGYDSSAAFAATNFGIRDFRKPTPPAADDGDPGDSPAEWGTAVHEDGKGRPDVFVMNLAGGGRRITHVFWALETKRSDIHHD